MDATDLVPGDVVLLEAGDRVPADGRLLSAHRLAVDESTLTGESMPVEKVTKTAAVADRPLPERTHMAFMNTLHSLVSASPQLPMAPPPSTTRQQSRTVNG